MRSKHKLDDIDRQILRDLQQDGRMSNVDLAARIGISAPPCLRRVKALEETGVIRGYHADINPTVLDYNVTVFALVGLANHSDQDLHGFSALANSWPMVREAYMMTGEFDFMLKVVAKDWDHYQKFLIDTVTAAPNVAHVKSSLTIRCVKALPGVPVDEPAEAVD